MKFETLYYKGHHIKFLNWQPNFHTNLIGKQETIKWMECKEIPSELMEETTINKICNSFGTVIGFENNPDKACRIRVLVKSEQNQDTNRKIITNQSIYKLKFEEYSGEIYKLTEAHWNKYQNTNIKELIKTKRDTGKTTRRKEKGQANNPKSHERKSDNANIEKWDKPKEAAIEEPISYQHSLKKFKSCIDCQKEKENIEEMESNVIKLHQLQHEILLTENDLIDQSLIAEEFHKIHKGKEILAADSESKYGTKPNQIQVKNLEKDMIPSGSIKINLKNQQSESRKEQTLAIMQESDKRNIDTESEVSIPPATSLQWSNITIRKKGKKKSYKFWKTPSDGTDMFALDAENNSSIHRVNSSPEGRDLMEEYGKQNNPTNKDSNKENKKVKCTEENQQISKLLITEIILEDQQEGEVSDIAKQALNEGNIDKLGIAINQEWLKTPICGRTKQKRGRKSLKELREAAGQVKDQTKISELLNNGKGKFLPKEQ